MITFFFLPGYESSKDSDTFDTDKVFGVPQEIIKNAISMSKNKKQCVFLNENSWTITEFKNLPENINISHVVFIKNEEIISHDILTSL